MPGVIIDDIPVEVPAGTTVIEAARQAGIWIPHFCYHPALGSVGACRVCAVKLLDGPVKGIQMSCMLPAQDGMIVSTTDAEAQAMRRHVIEWLMINHPHDCPVCDEGGECLLQDYTIAGGHGIRRYHGKKRTHLNQYLGPYIEHEMNRCIQCYRCVRFYQEQAGGADFGVMGSAGRVYFGRFHEGALESPLSGNLVDICPTGVFTDKTARFRARYWDYDMAPSVCPGCSLGCNITPAARYRELLKIMARRNDAVNGWFICDKGRFGGKEVNDPARPRIPRVDGRDVTWDEALDALVLRFGELCDLYSSESIALVGSPRLSLEGQILLARLAEVIEPGFVCWFTTTAEAEAALAGHDNLTPVMIASLADVRTADCLVIAGVDLLEDAPMMALAVRQAWRNGAKVYAVEGVEREGLLKNLGIASTPITSVTDVPFPEGAKSVVICKAGLSAESLARGTTCSGLDEALRAGAKVALLRNGPNEIGAALLTREHGGTSLEEALATGKIRGIVAVEADIPAEWLAGIPLVAACDWLPTATVAVSHIFLPATAWTEMDGTFINYEGRAQRFRKVMNPGLPIKGLDPALHPPRIHRSEAPGGDLRPSWQVIAELVRRHGGDPMETPFTGKWESLRKLDPEGEGMMVLMNGRFTAEGGT
jgi:NADH-quinone oxidoreductase subunit G